MSVCDIDKRPAGTASISWKTFPFAKKLFNTVIQKNEQANLSSIRAQLERLSQGLLKTLMSFVITRGKRSTLELGPHVFPTPRTFAEEPAAPAGAAQPGIAQDLKVINLHRGGSRRPPRCRHPVFPFLLLPF